MFRAIIPDGDIECHHYERDERGVEIFDESDTLIAFIPYQNLVALVNEEIEMPEERSYM